MDEDGLDIDYQNEGITKIEINHPSAISQHARGVQANDFRRMGITIRRLNFLSSQKESKRTLNWKKMIKLK
jgi:hypothetical protein